MRLTPLNCCAFGFRQSFASVVLRSSVHFPDAPGDYCPDVPAVAPCAIPALVDTPSLLDLRANLVGGTMTLGDASFTIKIAVHSGTAASTAFDCVALLDTRSSQTFIIQDV